MQSRHTGMLQTIASGLCFGFLGIFGKWLYEKGVKPGELLTLRFTLASAMMFAYAWIRHPQVFRLDWRQLLTCAWLGIGGYALFSFCFFSALGGLSASLTVLLLYAYPVLVAIGGAVLFHEKIPLVHLPAIPLALLGLGGLVWGDVSIERREALLFGIGSAVFYALYILVSSRYLRRVHPLASTPLIQAFAGLTLGLLYLRDFDRAREILIGSWWTVLGVAFICTVLAMSLFLAGLQKLKGWEVSILSTTEPLMGVLLATILLGERLTGIQTLGGLAVLISLVWVALPPRLLPFARTTEDI